MQKVAPDGTEVQWLQGLIAKASPNDIGAAGMMPIFNGTHQALDLEFQVSNTGAIRIDFSTDSGFATALRAELKTWCSAN